MDLSKNWRNLIEFIGIFALIASLVFVGFQLQQDQRLAEAQIYADFDDTQIELSRLVIENVEVWLAGSNLQELSEADSQTFEAVAMAVMAKYNGLMARAVRLKTDPVEDYALDYAFLLYNNEGLQNSFRTRCTIGQELRNRKPQRCENVLPFLEEFISGKRKTPHISPLAP